MQQIIIKEILGGRILEQQVYYHQTCCHRAFCKYGFCGRYKPKQYSTSAWFLNQWEALREAVLCSNCVSDMLCVGFCVYVCRDLKYMQKGFNKAVSLF